MASSDSIQNSTYTDDDDVEPVEAVEYKTHWFHIIK